MLIGVHTVNAREKAPAFIESAGIDYAVAFDVEDRTGKAYGVNSYPDYYVIDRAGTLRFADLANVELERAVKKLLAEPAPGTDLTGVVRAVVEAQPVLDLPLETTDPPVRLHLEWGIEPRDGAPELWTRAAVRLGEDVLRRVECRADPATLALTELREWHGGGDPVAELRVAEGRLRGRAHGRDVDLEAPEGLTTNVLGFLHAVTLERAPGAERRFPCVVVGRTAEDPARVNWSTVRAAGAESATVDGRTVAVRLVEVGSEGGSWARVDVDEAGRILRLRPVEEEPEEIVIEARVVGDDDR